MVDFAARIVAGRTAASPARCITKPLSSVKLGETPNLPRGGASDIPLPVSSSSRSVLLLGATGLVGSDCLRLLLAGDEFSRVVVLTRRKLEQAPVSDKLEAHVVNFEHLTAHADAFSVDTIICALGTTMKQAGSQARFRTVDLVYGITAAHLGLERGASQFLLVSSMGADPKSRIFYSRTKGELEVALRALPYASITIVRPSLLLGARAHPRIGERIAGLFAFAAPARFRPVASQQVAATLVRAARLALPGVTVIESAEIRGIQQTLQVKAHPAVGQT